MKKRGFTLVELMVGIAVVSVLIGAVVLTLGNLNKTYQKSTASSLRNEAIISAMNAMERQVERSYYVAKISSSEIVLKVKPTLTENPTGSSASAEIEVPYLIYIKQNPSSTNEIIGYCVGKTVGNANITPTSSSPEVIYDSLTGSGSLSFVILSTNKFYLPETVLFPGQTKTFQFYDEYSNSFNSTTQTFSIPGILIGNKINNIDTKFLLNLSTFGATNGVCKLTVNYLSRTGTGSSPTYAPIFSTNRIETYSDKDVVAGSVNAVTQANTLMTSSGSYTTNYTVTTPGALQVVITNLSSLNQIKLGSGSYVEVPYTITAGKSVIVTMSGNEENSDKGKKVELSNTLTGFEQ